MKISGFRIVIICLFLGSQITLFAQKSATWKGGTPGRNTDWFCPSNWEEGKVPNEFSRVTIPDVSTSTFSNPVVKEGTVEILSLQILSGGLLHLTKNARLLVTERDSDSALVWEAGIIRRGNVPDTLSFVKQ